jgi:hypothetical protein
MKYNISILILFVFLSTGLWAQQVTKTFSVSGNCGMCKKNIEAAAIKQGAASANWEKSSQSLTVSFDQSAVNEASLKQAIADAGYDNDGLKANENAYAALPDCCKYRGELATSSSCCMKDGACKGGKKCCKKQEGDKSCCKNGTCDKGDGCCKRCEKGAEHQCASGSSDGKGKCCEKKDAKACCKKKSGCKSDAGCNH